MIKTVTKLSDGRELIYFDDPEDAGSTAGEHGVCERDAPPDRRDLAPLSVSAHLRHDPLLDEWVIIAAHRQDRTHLPPTEACPLCPSTAERPTEIPASDYDVVVFENRFPPMVTSAVDGETIGALAGIADADAGAIGAASSTSSTGTNGASTSSTNGTAAETNGTPFRQQPASGRAEVVCFTADHTASFGSLTPTRARTVVEAWADRTIELSLLPNIEHVFPFENRGSEIGVTLSHPHGQIYAYPFVPARTQRMLKAVREYQQRTGRNLFADRLEAEQQAGTRVVARSEHWTAFVPYAARWPVEVHVFPHRQVADLPELTSDERDDFCHLYLDLLRRCDNVFGQALPYISAWHQAPVRVDRDVAYLHLQLFSIRRAADKLKHLAGSESAMGVFVSDVLPERTAEALRQAAP